MTKRNDPKQWGVDVSAEVHLWWSRDDQRFDISESPTDDSTALCGSEFGRVAWGGSGSKCPECLLTLSVFRADVNRVRR